MPYIKQQRREDFEKGRDYIENPGELNYMFTLLCEGYLRHNGTSYQSYNDIIGALEGAKLELYRRKVAPYEDEKIKENGDVYV